MARGAIARLRDGSRGFSLVEALVATAILTSALVSLAGVFGLAARASQHTRTTTSEVILATHALEVLRSATYEDQVPGEVVEYLDAAGRALDAGTPDVLPAFVRRVRIEPLEWDVANTVVIRVGVSAYRGSVPGATDVNLVALKTRK